MHFRELTDRYSLDKILRSTRTGTVLRATDSRSGQAVAVKLMNVPSPAELVQRAPAFEKLSAALESLRHPNLPLILDSGFTTEGSAFLVMELLDGRTLDTASGPPLRLLTLLFQALAGLEAMARRGLVHHNVSPDNLLILAGPEPAPERVKLLGLGTSLFRGAVAPPAETARFRAPELASPAPGETADWRADIYSFAYTACQVIGATVGLGDSPVVQLPFALSMELESSEVLRQTLERALRRNPAERPPHQEIRDAFRLALGVAEVPTPAEEKPAPGPKLVIPGGAAAAVLGSIDLPDLEPPAPKPAPVAAAAPPPRPVAVPAPPPAAAPPPLAAVPAAPAPPPATDETGGELLSSIDDDLLNALGPLPSAPAAAPAAGGPAAPVPPAGGTVTPFRRPGVPPGRGIAASAAPPPESPLRNPKVLLGAAVGLVLLLGILYWWFSRGVTPPAPAVAAAPETAAPPPRRPATEVLADAELAFADGDDSRALEILQTLTAADQSTLTPAGCRALQSLQDTLVLSAFDRLPDSLEKGLKGDMGRLRLAVMTTAGHEAALPESLRPDLERARGLVDLYNQIGTAAESKAHTEVLDRFAVLAQQLPNVTDPLHLRDQAADAIEAEAEAMAREGRYDEAVAHLGPIQRSWPGRPGFKARLDAYQRAQKDEAAQEQILADLPALERRNRPDEALDKIRGVNPTPHLAAQFAEARKRLEDHLAQIDGQPPVVELRDGYLLDYDRGRVVELSFRVTDDYKVRSVKLMARPQGGKMRELPLEASRLGYTVELRPDFHQNGTVEFYVTATDVSGHTGTFGTPDHPQQLKRREGFQRILR
jgi:serine/threonine-protein kinase